MKQVYLAIDLGAGSGRLVAGVYDGATLDVREVHRFANDGVEIGGRCFWNTPGLFASIVEGLKMAVAEYGEAVVSIAADTWGCDHALLDKQGNLLGGHRLCRHFTTAACICSPSR